MLLSKQAKSKPSVTWNPVTTTTNPNTNHPNLNRLDHSEPVIVKRSIGEELRGSAQSAILSY
jgi:hypothetical protein